MPPLGRRARRDISPAPTGWPALCRAERPAATAQSGALSRRSTGPGSIRLVAFATRLLGRGAACHPSCAIALPPPSDGAKLPDEQSLEAVPHLSSQLVGGDARESASGTCHKGKATRSPRRHVQDNGVRSVSRCPWASWACSTVNPSTMASLLGRLSAAGRLVFKRFRVEQTGRLTFQIDPNIPPNFVGSRISNVAKKDHDQRSLETSWRAACPRCWSRASEWVRTITSKESRRQCFSNSPYAR